MDRRVFVRDGCLGLGVIFPWFMKVHAAGTDEPPKLQGKGYAKLPARIRWKAPDDTPAVIEVFAYGCHHCYAFEKALRASYPKEYVWIKRISRVPAMFEISKAHAAAFYVAEELGLFERFHWAFYQAIHERKLSMKDDDEIATFFESLGITREEFARARSSTHVETNLEWARNIMGQARVESVPWVVVNGIFTCSPVSAGGNEALLVLIDDLLTEVGG